MKYLHFLAILFSASSLSFGEIFEEEKDAIHDLTSNQESVSNVLKYEVPQKFSQKLSLNEGKCGTINLNDKKEYFLAIASYYWWAESGSRPGDPNDSRSHIGCSCQEVLKIFDAIRTTRGVRGDKDFIPVFETLCDGYNKQENNPKLNKLLAAFKGYFTDDLIVFLKYAGFVARKYLTDMDLNDSNFGIKFVLDEIVNKALNKGTRADDIKMMTGTAIAFTVKLSLSKDIFNRIVDITPTDQSELQFMINFMRMAIGEAIVFMKEILQVDNSLIPGIMKNMSVLFTNEDEDEVETFAKNNLYFVTEIFKLADKKAIQDRRWKLKQTSNALKIFGKANMNYREALEKFPTITFEEVQNND